MLIKTSEPIQGCDSKIVGEIARFWNKISSGWQTLWGPHIHHGYYEDEDSTKDISPLEAQEVLLDKLCYLLDIKPESKILDAGCGLGGSSRFLAQIYQAEVSAITLSEIQIKIAETETSEALSKKIQYSIADAHHLNAFSDNNFDLVWSLESCEQFYDKERFIQEAFRVLKPKGKLMIATWCSDQEQYQDQAAINYFKLCKNFQLPYMPSIEFYKTLLEKRFTIVSSYDWTHSVKESWEIGIAHLKYISWTKLLKLAGLTGLKFVRDIKLMNEAFKSGQLKYGVFIAAKPK